MNKSTLVFPRFSWSCKIDFLCLTLFLIKGIFPSGEQSVVFPMCIILIDTLLSISRRASLSQGKVASVNSWEEWRAFEMSREKQWIETPHAFQDRIYELYFKVITPAPKEKECYISGKEKNIKTNWTNKQKHKIQNKGMWTTTAMHRNDNKRH